jgi:hypothetical protein
MPLPEGHHLAPPEIMRPTSETRRWRSGKGLPLFTDRTVTLEEDERKEEDRLTLEKGEGMMTEVEWGLHGQKARRFPFSF